jgi:hypothetical protein
MQRTRSDSLNPREPRDTGAPPRERPLPAAGSGLTPSELHALHRSQPLTTAQSHARGTRSSRP